MEAHGIARMLRTPNKGFELAAMMRKDRGLIGEVGAVLASDEFFRQFSCSGKMARKEAYANLVDLRAAARIFFASDAAYEQEICRVIMSKYAQDYSAAEKALKKEKN